MTKANVSQYHYKGDFAACVAAGGHCYHQGNEVVATSPAIYHRICKHCGHTQHGTPQPSMRWEHVEETTSPEWSVSDGYDTLVT